MRALALAAALAILCASRASWAYDPAPAVTGSAATGLAATGPAVNAPAATGSAATGSAAKATGPAPAARATGPALAATAPDATARDAPAPGAAMTDLIAPGAPSSRPPPRVNDLVEIGVGALTLPSVRLCLATSCTSTDLTLLLSFRNLVRFERVWALGAGVAWGFRPVTTDASMRAADGSLIERQHTRNYFMVSGMGRRYLVTGDRFQLWLGATGGLVIASDRYASKKQSESIIGPKATPIRTEGLMAGGGLGASWALSEAFELGGWTTEMLWKFPMDRACAATRECATVSGSLFSFETGIYLTYRVRL